MHKELTYQTPDGYTVFTAQYLINKGTCCRSACLHCPYGFTIKKHGLQFKEVREEDFPQIEAIIEESGIQNLDWKSFSLENIRFILLKEQVCGFFLKNHIVIKHLVLRTHFKQQNISRELVESYFF